MADNIIISVEARVENTGNSPAYNVRIGCNATQSMQGDVIEVSYNMDKIGGSSQPHPIVPQKSEIHKVIQSRKMKNLPNSQIRFIYMVEFTNLFGEIKTSPLISGIISKNPTDGGGIFVPDRISTEPPMSS